MEIPSGQLQTTQSLLVKKRAIYPQHSYIPLELSRMILKSIECPYQIVDSHDQMYIKALNGNANIEFKSGTTYKGKLRNGLMHGEGTISWENRQRYTGLFVNNKIHGRGKLELGNGGVYEGAFKNGMRQGYGVFRMGDGVYEGDWRKGRMHGHGKITFDDGEYYQGGFEKGVKQGEGTYHYQDGSVYRGNWLNNKRHGYGVYQSKSQYYSGNWEDDQPKGSGTIIWYDEGESKKPIRNRYEGAVHNNIRQGFGAFFYSNLTIYVGMWDNNSKQGLGYTINENGEYTSGIFKGDRLETCYTTTIPHKIASTTNGFDNTYGAMLDLQGIVPNSIVDQFNTICLRYNSQLKEWYRVFSEFSDQKYISYMELSGFWRFVKTYKVLELGESIPLFDRLINSSRKTRRTPESLPEEDFNFTINNVKNLEDLDNLYYIYQSKNTDQADAETKKCKQFENNKFDLHNPERLISYRAFVESIIKLAIHRAKTHNKPAPQILTQIFERCIKRDRIHKSSEFEQSSCNSSMKSGFAQIICDSTMQAFISWCFDVLSTNYEQRHQTKDLTTTIQKVFSFLQLPKLQPSTTHKACRFFLKQYYLHLEPTDQNIRKLLPTQLTHQQFKQFMLKWKSRYEFPTLQRQAQERIKKGKVGSRKMIEKRKLQEIRRGIDERKREIERRRLREEEDENQRVMGLMVEGVFRNQIDTSDSYISGQSDDF